MSRSVNRDALRPVILSTGDYHLGTPPRADHADKTRVFQDTVAAVISAKKSGRSNSVAFCVTGDMLNRNAPKDRRDIVHKAMNELKDAGILPVYMYGNDEDQSKFRNIFANELASDGIPVFRNGERNIAYVEENGKKTTAVVGLPLTLPQGTFRSLYKQFGLSKELAQKYITEAVGRYKDRFMKDLQEASRYDIPIYVLFHVPPFLEAYPELAELARQIHNPANDIIAQFDNIVGGSFAHIHKAPDVTIARRRFRNSSVDATFNRQGSTLYVEQELPTQNEWGRRRRGGKAA